MLHEYAWEARAQRWCPRRTHGLSTPGPSSPAALTTRTWHHLPDFLRPTGEGDKPRPGSPWPPPLATCGGHRAGGGSREEFWRTHVARGSRLSRSAWVSRYALRLCCPGQAGALSLSQRPKAWAVRLLPCKVMRSAGCRALTR